MIGSRDWPKNWPVRLFQRAPGVLYVPHPNNCFTDANFQVPAADGDGVVAMLDRSGWGYHLTETNATRKPILRQDATTLKWYLEHDGVDDRLSTASVRRSTGGRFSGGAAFRPGSVTGLQNVVDSGFNVVANTVGEPVRLNGTAGGSVAYDNSVTTFTETAPVTLSIGTDYVLTTVRNETSIETKYGTSTDGATATTGTPANDTHVANSIRFGGRNVGGQPFNGRIYGGFWFAEAMTLSEWDAMIEWLSTRI